MKKVMNLVENMVLEMCQGIVLAHPSLALDAHHKIIYRQKSKLNQVTLISGGGSGHEPAHAGFVGEGMLDAAVCGDVFASPSQVQIYQAIRKVANEAGVLLIIKNYSGDMMNFQGAQHLAKEDGIAVEYVKVDDDIAVQDSLYTVGRRGVAGTLFVHKIAGAAAEQGLPLSEVKRLAEKCVRQVKSLGVALSACTLPAKGSPMFELGTQEIEYGVGIHGEPGIARESLQTSQALVKKMLDAILTDLQLTGQDEVAVLVNGFGATPLMELYVIYQDVARDLEEKGIVIRQAWVGNYMTSIDMAGASLSILKLDEELTQYLGLPCDTPALKHTHMTALPTYSSLHTVKNIAQTASYQRTTEPSWYEIQNRFTAQNMIAMVDAMAEIVIANEVAFCELDAHAGDGDFGMSIAKGFRELKHQWTHLIQFETDMGEFLQEAALIMMEYCGGASGPIWGAAFRSAGKSVAKKRELTQQEFANMLQAMVEGIQAVGERSFGRGAVLGDKTLMDALIPTTASWQLSAKANQTWQVAFTNGAQAAVAGAKNTEQMVARLGRAGTVGTRSIGHPDAGAHALGIIFTQLIDQFIFVV